MELNSPFAKGTSTINKNKNILLDNDKLVVLLNDSCPVMNDCRLGRFKYQNQRIKYFQ